jgi:hypothetical protein
MKSTLGLLLQFFLSEKLKLQKSKLRYDSKASIKFKTVYCHCCTDFQNTSNNFKLQNSNSSYTGSWLPEFKGILEFEMLSKLPVIYIVQLFYCKYKFQPLEKQALLLLIPMAYEHIPFLS